MKYLAKIRSIVASSAVLAFVGTLFVQQVIEWEKGLTGEFIVYGQTGGTVPPVVPPGFTSKAIPELAAGNVSNVTYSTTIQILNHGSSAVTVSGSFFNEDGSAFSLPMTMTLNASAPVTFTGSFPNQNLASNSILVIGATAAAAAPAVIGWGQINSSDNVTVNTLIHLRDSGTGALLSRIGVAPSATDMQRFVVPRYSLASPGLITQSADTRDTGLALVNTGPTAAVLNATLLSAVGGILANKSITMGPRTHLAVFAHDFFNLNEPSGATLHTFIEFESFSPQWAATALSVEGSVFASIVVDRIN